MFDHQSLWESSAGGATSNELREYLSRVPALYGSSRASKRGCTHRLEISLISFAIIVKSGPEA
jgi:hypothetical protein